MVSSVDSSVDRGSPGLPHPNARAGVSAGADTHQDAGSHNAPPLCGRPWCVCVRGPVNGSSHRRCSWMAGRPQVHNGHAHSAGDLSSAFTFSHITHEPPIGLPLPGHSLGTMPQHGGAASRLDESGAAAGTARAVVAWRSLQPRGTFDLSPRFLSFLKVKALQCDFSSSLSLR